MVQVCSGVRAMHQMNPPMAHRDVKPHNVLVRSHSPPEPAVPRQRFLEQAENGSAAAAQQGHALAEAQSLHSPSPQGNSSSGRFHAVLMVGHPAVQTCIDRPCSQQSTSGLLCVSSLERMQLARECFGMGCKGMHPAGACSMQDFGSAREARVAVQNRAQALAQQEDAAAHCSAPYRCYPPVRFYVVILRRNAVSMLCGSITHGAIVMAPWPVVPSHGKSSDRRYWRE